MEQALNQIFKNIHETFTKELGTIKGADKFSYDNTPYLILKTENGKEVVEFSIDADNLGPITMNTMGVAVLGDCQHKTDVLSAYQEEQQKKQERNKSVSDQFAEFLKTEFGE